MRISELVERAEKLSRKTGNGSCLLCRNMRVKKAGSAECESHISGRAIYVVDGMDKSLPSMTVRAKTCENYDNMAGD